MKIKSLSIHNYKCHKMIENLPFHSLTTIIGENDSGKTAIIDFLEMMLTQKQPSQTDFRREIRTTGAGAEEITADHIEGEIEFLPDEDEAMRLSNYMHSGKLILRKKYTSDNCVCSVYKNCYSDKRFNDYEKLSAPELKSFMKEYGIEAQANQDLRKASVKKYIEESDIETVAEWATIEFKEIKDVLPKFIRYGVDDYKNPNTFIFKVLQDIFENEIYEKNDVGEKTYKDENLRTVINAVRRKIIESAAQFKDHIKRYNDKIIDVTFEPEIDLSTGLKQSPIMVKDETGIFHYLENRGYGTKKRIFLAIFDWNKEVLASINQYYAIRCYDEPDNNLHIEAQRKLYKSIKEIGQTEDSKNQVMICTHSLFMIDSVPASSINLIKRDQTGRTAVEFLKAFGDKEVQDFIELMCREMGLANSHIFFEKCFIIVEGLTEMNYLPIAYKKCYNSSLAEDGITLINLEGNGAAINFLKLLMKNKREITLLFLDNDTTNFRKERLKSSYNHIVDGLTQEEYTKFIEDFFSENVIFVGDKEFEDTISNELYVKTLSAHRGKNNASSWTIDEINDLRSSGKFSDAIIKLVKEHCEPNYLGKPELGTLLGKEMVQDEIPEHVSALFNKAREISAVMEP